MTTETLTVLPHATRQALTPFRDRYLRARDAAEQARADLYAAAQLALGNDPALHLDLETFAVRRVEITGDGAQA